MNIFSDIMFIGYSIFKTFNAYYGGIGYDPKAKNPRFRPSISRDQEKANLRIMELCDRYTPEKEKIILLLILIKI